MGKFTEYKLPLKSLTPGIHTFEYRLTKQFFSNMESADVHDADLTVNLTVDHKADLYSLSFHITGTMTLICDRCLDDLIMPVDTDYHISVKYGDRYCDDSDDLIEIPESDNFLNVAYMIYDTVALTIPMKHVHPMGKCNKQMSAILKKHRTQRSVDEDAELEETLIEEMDTIDTDSTSGQGSDPRWDALKGLTGSESGE